MTFKKFNHQRGKMGLSPIISRYSDNKLNSKKKFIFIWVQNFTMLNLRIFFSEPGTHCYKLKTDSGRFMYDLAHSIDIKQVAQNKGYNFIFSQVPFSDYRYRYVHDDISFMEITDTILGFVYGNLDDSLIFDRFTGYFSNKSMNKLAEECDPTKFELYRLVAEHTLDPVQIISL